MPRTRIDESDVVAAVQTAAAAAPGGKIAYNDLVDTLADRPGYAQMAVKIANAGGQIKAVVESQEGTRPVLKMWVEG
jgi:hypothetical protein